MEFKGVIKWVSEIKSGTSARGEWKSMDIMVEETNPQNAQYPQKFIGTIMKAEIIEKLKKGSVATISFNLKARESNNKWYGTNDVWKIWYDNNDQAPQSAQTTTDSNNPF